MSIRLLLAMATTVAPVLVAGAAEAAGPSCDGRRATIVGTAGDDVIRGTRHADVIVGLTGSDSIEGLGGDDRICGGFGADRLRGGPGDDRVFGGQDRLAVDDEGATSRTGDTLRGGPGRDRLVPGRDTREAEDENPDAILWDTSPRAVRLDLASGRAFGDGPDSFVAAGAFVVGSRFADRIDGTSGPDLVQGAQGADVVSTFGGPDRVVAGSGDDLVRGGAGDDSISGDAGEDELHGGVGEDVLDDMAASADVLRGEAGDDLLIGEMVRSTRPQVYAGGPGRDKLALFSNRFNPTAAASTGTWDMRTDHLDLTLGTAQRVTVTGFEIADLSTFGASWSITGTGADEDVSVGSMRGSTFLGLGGDDEFLGSAFDDLFEGGPGIDRSHGMGAGTDTCRSVEVLEVADCETVSP